jgi:hypothetical protein
MSHLWAAAVCTGHKNNHPRCRHAGRFAAADARVGGVNQLMATATIGKAQDWPRESSKFRTMSPTKRQDDFAAWSDGKEDFFIFLFLAAYIIIQHSTDGGGQLFLEIGPACLIFIGGYYMGACGTQESNPCRLPPHLLALSLGHSAVRLEEDSFK